MTVINLADIHEAAPNVRQYTIRTAQHDPDLRNLDGLRKSSVLSARLGVKVQLKLEMQQHSGSFKTRGAFHQMLTLGDAALSRGVVAVSGGNFARAVGYCSRRARRR